jgi:tRNA A-37 threonylcarbamoyl transferase component Bud32
MGVQNLKRTLLETRSLEAPGYRGTFDRRFADEQSMLVLARRVDRLMQEGQVLKEDAPSFISRVLWNDQDAVIKRYNHRSFWHSLRYTIRGSRAKRNWLCAHHLLNLGIATPEPLAYWDEYKGPFLWRSYFVARFVAGRLVHHILRDKDVSASEKQRISDEVLVLLRVMGGHGVSHGDMKHANILYDGTNVVLTDLDAMRVGGLRWLRRRRCQRDVDRYLRDLHGLTTTSTPSQGTR